MMAIQSIRTRPVHVWKELERSVSHARISYEVDHTTYFCISYLKIRVTL
jgi:hypothetical protein